MQKMPSPSLALILLIVLGTAEAIRRGENENKATVAGKVLPVEHGMLQGVDQN